MRWNIRRCSHRFSPCALPLASSLTLVKHRTQIPKMGIREDTYTSTCWIHRSTILNLMSGKSPSSKNQKGIFVSVRRTLDLRIGITEGECGETASGHMMLHLVGAFCRLHDTDPGHTSCPSSLVYCVCGIRCHVCMCVLCDSFVLLP